MFSPSVSCPRCQWPLPPAGLNTGEFVACAACGTPTMAVVFPALLRPIALGTAGETIMVDGEASCFYHPQKRAEIHCQSCGRFLCALCDVELNGQHLCPTCLESGQRKGKITELENKRVLYDSAALSLALLPLIMWPVTIITGPAAIGVAIYGWNRSNSVLARTRLRAILAILIGLAEIVGWGFLIYVMIKGS